VIVCALRRSHSWHYAAGTIMCGEEPVIVDTSGREYIFDRTTGGVELKSNINTTAQNGAVANFTSKREHTGMSTSLQLKSEC
jgi:hypothetical protein